MEKKENKFGFDAKRHIIHEGSKVELIENSERCEVLEVLSKNKYTVKSETGELKEVSRMDICRTEKKDPLDADGSLLLVGDKVSMIDNDGLQVISEETFEPSVAFVDSIMKDGISLVEKMDGTAQAFISPTGNVRLMERDMEFVKNNQKRVFGEPYMYEKRRNSQ